MLTGLVRAALGETLDPPTLLGRRRTGRHQLHDDLDQIVVERVGIASHQRLETSAPGNLRVRPLRNDIPPEPVEMDEADLKKTLEQLDNFDDFSFGRARGRGRRVQKDW